MTGPEQNFESNLRALAGRDPTLAAALRPAAALSNGLRPVVRTAPGGRWWIEADQDGRTERLLDSEEVRARIPDLAARISSARPAAVLLMDAGLEGARAVLSGNLVGSQGTAVPVYVVESDLALLRAYLHIHDLSAELAEERLILFGGPDSWNAMASRILERRNLPLPNMTVSVQDMPTAARDKVSRFLSDLGRKFAADTGKLASRLETYWSTEPWKEALAGRRPLRVLAYGPRKSTFIRHSIRDLAMAGPAAGCEVIVLEEPSAASLPTVGWVLAACERHRADIVLAVDWPPPEEALVLSKVPWVCWVQDEHLGLAKSRLGREGWRLGFWMGWGRNYLTHRYGLPADRFLSVPVPANPAIYRPVSVTLEQRRRWGCQVSFVSHQSQDPRQALAGLKTSLRLKPENAGLLDALLDRLDSGEGLVDSSTALDDLLAGLERDRGREWDGADDRRTALRTFFNLINNLVYREKALGWVAESGADLRLYGRGWERHPRLKRLAAGEVANGDELNLVYRCSAVNLQIVPYPAVHQRLLDGLAAGGFFLMTGHSFHALLPAARWAAAALVGGAKAEDLDAGAPPELREPLRRLHDHADKLLGRGEYDWANFLRFAAEDAWMSDPQLAFPGIDVAGLTFRTRAEAHQRLRHFLGHPAERAEIAAAMRRAVLDRFTSGAVLGRLVKFLRERLTTEAGT